MFKQKGEKLFVRVDRAVRRILNNACAVLLLVRMVCKFGIERNGRIFLCRLLQNGKCQRQTADRLAVPYLVCTERKGIARIDVLKVDRKHGNRAVRIGGHGANGFRQLRKKIGLAE